MALAVLATNLMPVSLAAETAEELQTDEVATQALTDEIDHRLSNIIIDMLRR